MRNFDFFEDIRVLVDLAFLVAFVVFPFFVNFGDFNGNLEGECTRGPFFFMDFDFLKSLEDLCGGELGSFGVMALSRMSEMHISLTHHTQDSG